MSYHVRLFISDMESDVIIPAGTIEEAYRIAEQRCEKGVFIPVKNPGYPEDAQLYIPGRAIRFARIEPYGQKGIGA